MKILHIIPNLGKGGAERICLNICHQFQTMGHEVKLIILEDINEYSLISDGIDILKFDVLKRLDKCHQNDIPERIQVHHQLNLPSDRHQD